MTFARLGLAPDGNVPVWIAWIDGEPSLLEAIAALVPLACPECQGAVDLARARGVLHCLAATPNSVSVSDQCPHCRARLHFDATPADRRDDLWWPRVAMGEALRPTGQGE